MFFNLLIFARYNRNQMRGAMRSLHRGLYLFPVVLLSAHSAASLYHLFIGKADKSLAFYFFTGGVFSGWLSVATGVISLFLLKASKVIKGVAFIHGFINSIALLILSVLWAKDASDFPTARLPEAPEVAFKLLALGLLLAGTFLGRSAIRRQLK